MPMPMPNHDEKQEDFIDRCMSMDMMQSEFPDLKQRAAVCFSQYRRRNTRKLRKEKRKMLTLSGSLQLRKLSGDEERIIGGYASVPIADSDGDLIPLETLQAIWLKFISSDYPILTMYHDDVPIGRILPEYTDSQGTIHKSGVDETGLYVVGELRKDTKTSDELWGQIAQWGGKGAFSISANVFKEPRPTFTEKGQLVHLYAPDSMELNSITVGKQGANEKAIFQLIKSSKKRVLVIR